MNNGNLIVGRTENNDKYDFYETPKWATEKAVEKMLIDGVINKYAWFVWNKEYNGEPIIRWL